MIELTDRIFDVLARDPRLVDVFVSVSPTFEKLRKKSIARVMTKLVTVEQAARVANVDPSDLRDRLNAALGLSPAPAAEPRDAPAPVSRLAPIPSEVRALEPYRVLDVDVRRDIREGREPFSNISEAASTLPPGYALRVRAPFEPVPLYGVLAKRGLAHHTEQLGPEDFRVWFVHDPRAVVAHPVASADRPPPDDVCDEAGCVTIDVRGLEPPEPMIRTLQALEALPSGQTLVQINERIPRFLLPKLEERGFEHEVHYAEDGTVNLHIRHRRKEPS